MSRRWCAVLLACWGCSAEPADRLSIDLEVTVDDGAGQAVAGAAIDAGGEPIGTTDLHGRVAQRLRGAQGQVLPIGLRCPAGLRAREPRSSLVVFRRLLDLGAGAAAIPRQQITFACLPRTRAHLLIVRTDERVGLSVRVTGEAAVTTDAQGVAQLLLRGASGEEVEVVIDTSSQPALRPAMPSRRLRLPSTSSFLIFDQQFSERRPERPRRRRSRTGGPRRI
jgi:hypothetical protein